jgi:hypothetical protein
VYQGHTSETDPEEDQEHDAIEQYVAQHFGEKGSAHLQKAAEVSYWGRNDGKGSGHIRSSNLGSPNQPGGNFRTTKTGKMYGQDVKMMKNKVADRLGRHPEPALPEGFNGEYDDEAGMAQSNLLTTARAVQGLLDTIKDRDNLPEWAQEKIAKAEMMLVSVWDYLQSQKEMGNDPQVGMEEARTNYHANTKGFSRGPRDDEQHDLDTQVDPREFRMYNLTINGKPLNPQPIMGRSNLIKFGKQQAAAGVDLSNAMISLVDEGVTEVAPPGWEKTVKAMKKHDNIDNPYALAWSMKNKGYKSHKKENTDPYFESLNNKLDDLKKK